MAMGTSARKAVAALMKMGRNRAHGWETERDSMVDEFLAVRRRPENVMFTFSAKVPQTNSRSARLLKLHTQIADRLCCRQRATRSATFASPTHMTVSAPPQ